MKSAVAGAGLGALIVAAGIGVGVAVVGGGIPSSAPTVAVTAATTCTYRGPLPDPVCTPGVTNPDVTDATIQQTICVRGWTATIRPPVSYTDPLKRRSMSAYGVWDQNPRDFELDHLDRKSTRLNSSHSS